MLAEKISSIEMMLPKELQNKVQILSGEQAWASADALQVVDWFSSQGISVVGVELWHDSNNSAQWVATSDYSCGSASECAQAASDFIVSFQRFGTDSLFNLTVD